MIPDTGAERGKLLFSFKDNCHDRNEGDRWGGYFALFRLSVAVLFLSGLFFSITKSTAFYTNPLLLVIMLGLFAILFFSLFMSLLFIPLHFLFRLFFLPSQRKVKVYTNGIQILYPESSRFRHFNCFVPFSQVRKMKLLFPHDSLVCWFDRFGGPFSAHRKKPEKIYLQLKQKGRLLGRYTLRNTAYAPRVLEAYERYKEQNLHSD